MTTAGGYRGLILAGGAGSRLGLLGRYHPKALLPLAGGTLLHHQLFRMRESGIHEVAISGTIKRSRLRRALSDEPTASAVSVHVEGERGTGMAAAVLREASRGDSPVVVLHGDAVLGSSLASLLKGLDVVDGAVLVDSRDPGPAYQPFTIRPRDGCLATPGPDDRRYWIRGCYAVHPEPLARAATLAEMPPSASSLDLVATLVAQGGRILACRVDHELYENVNTPQSLLKANRLLLSLEDYHYWCHSPGLHVRRDHEQHVGNSLVLGPSWIGSESHLQESRVEPFTSVGRSVRMFQSVAADAIVGPGTLLADARVRGIVLTADVSNSVHAGAW